MAVAALIDGAANRVRVEQQRAAAESTPRATGVSSSTFAEGERGREQQRRNVVHALIAAVLQMAQDARLPAPDRPVTIRNFMLASSFFCSVFAQNTNLRLELHAGLLKDALLHLPHQFEHVARRRAADVDDKARVLLADLRAADGEAAQAAVVDELGGEMPLRALKRAACAGQRERLLLPARFGTFLHPRADGFQGRRA